MGVGLVSEGLVGREGLLRSRCAERTGPSGQRTRSAQDGGNWSCSGAISVCVEPVQMEGDERTWQWRTEGPILLGEERRKQQELQREIDATAGPLEPVVKRKRKRVQVARACQQCRRTKSACSGYRPCANCVRKGHECVATDGTKYTASDSSGVNSSVVEWPSATIETLLEMISDLKRSNGLLLQENRRLRLQCAGIHASATAPHPPVPLSSENTSLLSWSVGNATIARSIWRVSDMHLLSYNETFMTRCGQSTSTLSDFSCMKLIPMTYHHKCMQVAMALMSGKSTSVRMIQLWNVGDRLIPMRTEIEILSNCGDGEARVIMANELASSFVPGTEFQLDFNSSSSASHMESSDPGSMQSGDCSDSPLSSTLSPLASMRGEESMINEVFDMLYENSRNDERCGPQHPQSTGFVWEETISSRE